MKEFPFLSVYDLKNSQKPFLGEGYYFWEFNLDYAKNWGRRHYSGSFFICQTEVQLSYSEDSLFLDLAGSRQHLVGFLELLDEFKLIDDDGAAGIELCSIIQYLRTSVPPEAFPYRIIRAVDNHNHDPIGVKVSFNILTKSYTYLNPRFIVAYSRKEDIEHLIEPFIIFAS